MKNPFTKKVIISKPSYFWITEDSRTDGTTASKAKKVKRVKKNNK